MTATDIFIVSCLTVCNCLWLLTGTPSHEWLIVGFAGIAGIMSFKSVMDCRPHALLALITSLIIIGLVLSLGHDHFISEWRFLTWSIVWLFIIISSYVMYLFPVPKLPSSLGPHEVGVSHFDLTDYSRTGVLSAPSNEPRHLQVFIWYPAMGDSTNVRALYLDKERSKVLYSPLRSFAELLHGVFLHTKLSRTHSFDNPAPAALCEPAPVILFSHGYTSYPQQYYTLMESLASHGYVVYSISHPYDSMNVLLDNGTTIPISSDAIDAVKRFSNGGSEKTRKMFAGHTNEERYQGLLEDRAHRKSTNDRLAEQSAQEWVSDRKFVLNALRSNDVPNHVLPIIKISDLKTIAHMGKSFGGSTAAATAYEDEHCVAAINLDAPDFHYKLNENIPVPLLMLYSDMNITLRQFGYDKPSAPSFAYNLFSYEHHETAGLRDDIYRIQVNGAGHLAFSDIALSVRPPLRNIVAGPKSGPTSLELINELILLFLDKHVRASSSQEFNNFLAKNSHTFQKIDATQVRDWWEKSKEASQRIAN